MSMLALAVAGRHEVEVVVVEEEEEEEEEEERPIAGLNLPRLSAMERGGGGGKVRGKRQLIPVAWPGLAN